MTSVFKKEDYDTACTVVLCAASVGTIAVYAFSPLCIYFAGWRSIFVVSALCAILMTIVWVKKCPVVSTKNNVEKSADTQGMKMSGSVYLFTGFLLIAIAIQGTLRDGVTTWMPSYISETFQLDNKIAILTGIILPIFSIVAVQLTSALYRKFAKNELLLAGTIFATGCITNLTLYFTNGVSPILSIFLSALLTGCMHGVNWIMTCIMPLKFKKYGKISFMSGLLNSFTYVGSSISVYAIAIFSEHSGWSATLLMWSGIAFVGMVICLALSKKNKSL